MRLQECFRLLKLDPRASSEDIKRAHRDLARVWHPDRFGDDAALRRKAEEKLKAINEAYETIRASRRDVRGDGDDGIPEQEGTSWRVRWHGREGRAASLQEIANLVARGNIDESAEVLDPGTGRWSPLIELPDLRTALVSRRMRSNRNYALTCAAIAILILLRRPTPAGLVIALLLFTLTAVFIARMRASGASRPED